jgi:hypothetical protein
MIGRDNVRETKVAKVAKELGGSGSARNNPGSWSSCCSISVGVGAINDRVRHAAVRPDWLQLAAPQCAPWRPCLSGMV